MSTLPLVSIVVPMYNAARFVGAAISSALAQDYPRIEVVVVDDGSTDEGAAIVRRFGTESVRLVSQSNQGEAAARNRGIDEASGELIAWLDADDLCAPSRIRILVETLLATNADFVHSDMLLIDADDEPIGLWRKSNIRRECVLPHILRLGTPFNNPTMMIRTQAISGCRHDVTLRIGTDTDFVSQFAPRCKGVHVPDPLVLYRRHANSATARVGREADLPHLSLLLNRHPLSDLVPEAWYSRTDQDAQAVAAALIALFLARRGLTGAAVAWLRKAASAVQRQSAALPLVGGIAALVAGDVETASRSLASCDQADAIASNYRGELLAQKGDFLSARQEFERALRLAPRYDEPLSNLARIGAVAVPR